MKQLFLPYVFLAVIRVSDIGLASVQIFRIIKQLSVGPLILFVQRQARNGGLRLFGFYTPAVEDGNRCCSWLRAILSAARITAHAGGRSLRETRKRRQRVKG